MNVLSMLPSVFNRTIRLTDCPLNMVKSPPTKTFPSGWITVARTELLAPVPGSKDRSKLPGCAKVKAEQKNRTGSRHEELIVYHYDFACGSAISCGYGMF